jgi:hypothetical protein
MPKNDERKIRFQGREIGSYTLDELYRMATSGKIDHTAEFWSKRQRAWCPLAGLTFDFQPPRSASIRSAGVEKGKILGSGSQDCPACSAIAGKVYPIDQVPTLPPTDCTCIPWCRCIEIATR